MPDFVDRRLSANFTLHELLRSDTAERQPALMRAQLEPPADVVRNLEHLVATTLQPLRDALGVPIRVSSGYRSPRLNRAVGGSATSQHLVGQAADISLGESFLTDPATEGLRREVEAGVYQATRGHQLGRVNANFHLFALVCLRLRQLDIDQVIHEYGRRRGQPAWVHVAASPGAGGRRQMLCIGTYPRKRGPLSLYEALALGC